MKADARLVIRGRHRKALVLSLPQRGTRSDMRSQRFFRKLDQTARISKERKWQRGIVTHPLSDSQMNRGHFSVKKWESEKAQELGRAS